MGFPGVRHCEEEEEDMMEEREKLRSSAERKRGCDYSDESVRRCDDTAEMVLSETQ
jgi:hypothetical protein